MFPLALCLPGVAGLRRQIRLLPRRLRVPGIDYWPVANLDRNR
jgi:hypothetical protein